MSDRELAAGGINEERLGIFEIARAGGRIANMADRAVALEFFEVAGLEDLRDEAHAFVGAERLAVPSPCDDACAFLAAVLKGEESVIGQHRGVGMIERREHSAFVGRLVRSGRSVIHASRRKYRPCSRVQGF